MFICPAGSGKTYRFVDPSPGAYNVNFSKLFLCHFERSLKLHPVDDVGFLKDGTRVLGIRIDNRLRLRPKCQISDQDVAPIFQQEFGKAQIDSYVT